MSWNCQRFLARIRVDHTNMATFLPHNPISQFFERSQSRHPRKEPAIRSYLYRNDMITEIMNGFQVPDFLFCLLFETEIDDLMDVLERFIQCLPLGITSWKERALNHIEAVFVFFNKKD
jgi:hypothetical protein